MRAFRTFVLCATSLVLLPGAARADDAVAVLMQQGR